MLKKQTNEGGSLYRKSFTFVPIGIILVSEDDIFIYEQYSAAENGK